MVLGDVEETIYVVEEDDDEDVKVRPSWPVVVAESFTPVFNNNLQTISRKSEMLFVRGKLHRRLEFARYVTDLDAGDSVVLISPQSRG